MSNHKILLIILLTLLTVIMVFFVVNRKVLPLVSPVLKQQPSPVSSVSSYNPPKEIKYDSSTNLGQELETVDPKVLDSDFE